MRLEKRKEDEKSHPALIPCTLLSFPSFRNRKTTIYLEPHAHPAAVFLESAMCLRTSCHRNTMIRVGESGEVSSL
jgi:hypothetical protein